MSDIYVATSVIVIAMFLATIWIIDAIRDNANKVDNAVLHNIHDLLQRHSEEMRSMSWKQERHEDFVTYTTNENSDRLDKQIEILTDISQEIVGQGRSVSMGMCRHYVILLNLREMILIKFLGWLTKSDISDSFVLIEFRIYFNLPSESTRLRKRDE